MAKVVWFRFQQCLVPRTCCLSKGPLKGNFLEIWLKKFFGVRNFGNTSTMREIFFWGCSKLNLHFRNAEKNWENVFSFWDNCIRIGCLKLSPLRREYFLLEVNMLKNILKTLHSTKKDFFQLNCLRSDQYGKYGKCGAIQLSTVFGQLWG